VVNSSDAAPDELTTEHRIAKRGSRIYLDTNRNAYAQTAVAPYSPRARPGAPVATPLDFTELSRAEPDGHDTVSIARRLARKADPWSDMAAHAGSAARARAALTDVRDVNASEERPGSGADHRGGGLFTDRAEMDVRPGARARFCPVA